MEKRQAIAALLDAGCPAKAVASDLKVGLTLVYKVKNLVKAGADLQPHPQGGRKRTARAPRAAAGILRRVKTAPNKSLRRVAQEAVTVSYTHLTLPTIYSV